MKKKYIITIPIVNIKLETVDIFQLCMWKKYSFRQKHVVVIIFFIIYDRSSTHYLCKYLNVFELEFLTQTSQYVYFANE